MFMKKFIYFSLIIFSLILLSCEEDKECKDCKIIVETLDSAGNVLSTEEKDHQTLCEDELYEKESADPVIIDNRKSYWQCN